MSHSTVIDDLKRWGPESVAEPLSPADSERYCRKLATSHYENFPVASLFLPRKLHQHFYNVYAYCRWADDLGDETGDPSYSLKLLHWWNEQLEDCYNGKATHPVFVALRPTIEKFSIPITPFADLISAFVQDQVVREYDTQGQLLDYCRRSANPVGRIILKLGDVSNELTDSLSDSICTGLQLANFWQDVSRDFQIGRVYLPSDVRSAFNYSDEDLHERRTTPEFIELMKHQVHEAETLLADGRKLLSHLPGRLKLDIDLISRGGLLMLNAIREIDYRVWETRPVVTKSQLAFAGIKTLLRIP
ncbi:squalene synthase HpnC [Planctomicrobium sp. SH668]|uniref:squalene synthase HpnC n=1 Tax=Planctomicrobium sp. SH668 TaxID=3448126 RepID=UPI003F5BC6F5